MPGAAVGLYAWPSDAVLKALKPGALVPTILLAAATTTSAGKYMLRVPAAKLKAAAVESGYANLEIDSPIGGMWFFPYQTGALPAGRSAPVTVNFTSNKNVSCGKDNQGQALYNTGFNFQRARQNTNAIVGQGFIRVSRKNPKATEGDHIKFDYDQGSSASQESSLGLGLSGYGFDAGYNADGSNANTSIGGEGYPKEYRNSYFLTEFSVGQYRDICYAPVGGTVEHEKQHGQCPRTWTDTLGNVHKVRKCFWLIASTGWFGGATIVHKKWIPPTPSRFCAVQEAGTEFHTRREAAIDWGSGFELGASLGIKGVTLKASFNGSAQTGYDANAEMHFEFQKTGRICGNNRRPPKAGLLTMEK